MTGVRIRDGEFEGQCVYCGEFLPLTAEFWTLRSGVGVRRCKACAREYKRLKQQGYAGDKLRMAVWRANQRAHYRSMSLEEKQRRLAVNRAWKEANREHVAAYRKAYYHRTRAA